MSEYSRIAELQNLAGMEKLFCKRTIAEELERRKLIALIHHCTSCEECRDEDIADHLIANGVTVQEWIPVAEGLPVADFEEYYRVNGEYPSYLVKIREGVIASVLEFTGEEWRDTEGNSYNVTHWMPLPAPPEE